MPTEKVSFEELAKLARIGKYAEFCRECRKYQSSQSDIDEWFDQFKFVNEMQDNFDERIDEDYESSVSEALAEVKWDIECINPPKGCNADYEEGFEDGLAAACEAIEDRR